MMLLLCGVASSADAALPAWTPGPSGGLAFESSDFMKLASYSNPDRLGLDCAPDGAYSPLNRSWDVDHQGHWRIEEQRYGFEAVAGGLAWNRQDVLARAERIFDWGFSQQQPDGSFACDDAYHSTSFFVEAVAHARLLIQASALGPENEPWVDRVKPKLALAAHWMADPAVESRGRRHDSPYNHRDYLDAAALGETGVLCGEPLLVRRSWTYAVQGIGRQAPDGFNPEKGGWDTSYHAVGLDFAITYYSLVADEAMRSRLRPMIERGLTWLEGRLRPDGSVDQSGNTRSGARQEKGPNGTYKTMSYGSAWRAAYAWAMITRDPRWERMAADLVKGKRAERKRPH
jgi:hypothetical protein